MQKPKISISTQLSQTQRRDTSNNRYQARQDELLRMSQGARCRMMNAYPMYSEIIGREGNQTCSYLGHRLPA